MQKDQPKEEEFLFIDAPEQNFTDEETGTLIANSIDEKTGLEITTSSSKKKSFLGLFSKKEKPKKEKPKKEKVKKENKASSQKKQKKKNKLRDELKKKAAKRSKKKSIPEIKKKKAGKEEVGRFHKRQLGKAAKHYIRAAFEVLLHSLEMEKKQKTYTWNLPDKYLAPNKKSVMNFCSLDKADRYHGTSFKISMAKKHPYPGQRDILQEFVDKYEKWEKERLMREIDQKIFLQISEILKKKKTNIQAIFKYPHLLQEERTMGEIIKLLKKRKIQELELENFVQNLIQKYQNSPESKISQILKRKQIILLAQALPAKHKKKMFRDRRLELPVYMVIQSAKKILAKMSKANYDLRITSQVIAERANWSSKVSPNASLGIRGIQSLEDLRGKNFAGYYDKYQEKIEKLATGRLSIGEDSRDIAQKAQPGTRTRELENLLINAEQIKKMPPGKPYPNVEGRLKFTMINHLFMALNLFILTSLCLFSGSLNPQIPNIPHPFLSPPNFQGWNNPEIFFDTASIVLGTWAMLNLILSCAIVFRRGRYFSLLNAIIWGWFNLLLLLLNGTIGYLQIPWIFISLYQIYNLCGAKVAAHFSPEFGKNWGRLTQIAQRMNMLSFTMLAILLCYIGALILGYLQAQYALSSNPLLLKIWLQLHG